MNSAIRRIAAAGGRPADVGQRPDLKLTWSLPLRPSAAPDLAVAGSGRRPAPAGGFRGRPIVILFYLGHGCVHCVEQLKAFQKLREQYKQAGLELVAISTDTPQELFDSLNSGIEGGPNFTFLSADAERNVFKAYRAFDDFENQPLHGTFFDRRRWADPLA